MRTRRLIGVLALGLGATLILLAWANTTVQASLALPDILYAAHDCTGIPNCYSTIQSAVNAAHDGDTIRVIQGTYLEAVAIAKSVTLEGGWSPDTLHRDWKLYTTTIDAQKAGSAIRATGQISPTVDGFVLTGGDASGYLGWGGGILVDGTWGQPGLAIIRHNVITDNVACHLSSCQGYGGGIMVYSSQSIIEYNTVISNAARTGGNGSGTGGGIAIWGYPDDSTVAHNDIIANTAVFSPAGAFANGEGGGFWSEHDVTLIDNELRGNVAAVKGEGLGGGAYAGGELYDNRVLSNTASMNGTGMGGGVYAYYVTDFDSNRVQGNIASASGDGSGGAIYAIYLRRAQHNQIEGNTATRGGGIYFDTYSGSQEFTDNDVMRNHATGGSLTTWDGGGGIASRANWVQILRNDILSNTAVYLGGGVLATGGSRYAVEDNILQGNQAGYGGGVLVYSATGVIAHNQIIGNAADNAGGGIYLYTNAGPTVDGNVVLSNTASFGGGGVCILNGTTPVTLTNQIIAHSGAGVSGGAGTLVNGSQGVRLLNNTLVDNTRGSNREGVRLMNGSRVTMTNNIIVGHSVAVSVVVGSAAVLTHNDYWDNTIGVSGQPSGTTDMTLDPQLKNRAGGDYHIGLASPMAGAGTDAGVTVDVDGEARPAPAGTQPDIGADEVCQWCIYLPLTLK